MIGALIEMLTGKKAEEKDESSADKLARALVARANKKNRAAEQKQRPPQESEITKTRGHGR